jgi:hypothetical protein
MAAVLRKQPKILSKRNASQFARLSEAMGSNGFVCKPVKPATLCVTCDRGVELRRVERLIPGAKLGKLARGEPLNGLFDFFGGGHR